MSKQIIILNDIEIEDGTILERGWTFKVTEETENTYDLMDEICYTPDAGTVNKHDKNIAHLSDDEYNQIMSLEVHDEDLINSIIERKMKEEQT